MLFSLRILHFQPLFAFFTFHREGLQKVLRRVLGQSHLTIVQQGALVTIFKLVLEDGIHLPLKRLLVSIKACLLVFVQLVCVQHLR